MAQEQSIVEQLRHFTTCDVADALLKLGHKYGGFLSGITMWSPERQAGETKIVGFAYTVCYDRKDPSASRPKHHYIDSVPPNAHAVVFISAPAGVPNALYGGLMSTRANHLGAVGTIVDGRIRDLSEHRAMEYPVFARDVGTTSPSEALEVREINKPALVQSNDQRAVYVNPGDILMGDLNGVVCIPRDLAEKVVVLMPSQQQADELIAQDLLRGRIFAEASKEHRSQVLTAKDLVDGKN